MQVSHDVLEDPRYKCNIPAALAETLAKNVGINLSNYLLYV